MNSQVTLESFQNYNWKDYLTLQKIVYQFAIGFLSCLLGANLLSVLGAHLAWELFTNWDQGRAMTLRYFGRDFSDHDWQTSLADNLLFAAGWMIAYSTCGKGSLQEHLGLQVN